MPDLKKVHLPVAGKGAELIKLEAFSLPSQPFVPQDVASIDIAALALHQRTELRTSSYTIYVDLPDASDEMLLVHGYTGAYDRVSRKVATYLRSLEARHAPRPLYGTWTEEPRSVEAASKPSPETIEILEQRGYLVTLTPDEEEALFVHLVARYHRAALHQKPSYVLMPTYQCNLRCPYCFQDHMRTDPAYSHLLRVIDRPMADRILRGMDAIDAAHGLTGEADVARSITLFGGEPLLAASKPIIEYFMGRVRERGRAIFTAISNATELDAYRDLLGPHGISHVQITLDGPPAEHDRRRIHADGSGSFERIADNLTMALELGVQVSVRMNIDRNNIGHLSAAADELHARGWIEKPNFRVYVAPVHAANGNVAPNSTFNSWQLGLALDELRQRDPRLGHIGLSDDTLQQQARTIFEGEDAGIPMFRTSFCGAHSSMYVIDAFADIYACWERTGDPSVRIGHIAETGEVLMNRSYVQRWRGRNVVSNPVCRKCRYATSCGGGCAVLAEEASGEAYTNHCDGFAKRFRASVARAYGEYLRGEQRTESIARLCDA
jgi:uncharacterized protein